MALRDAAGAIMRMGRQPHKLQLAAGKLQLAA